MISKQDIGKHKDVVIVTFGLGTAMVSGGIQDDGFCALAFSEIPNEAKEIGMDLRGVYKNSDAVEKLGCVFYFTSTPERNIKAMEVVINGLKELMEVEIGKVAARDEKGKK